jgi:hypothetical protein
MSIGIRSASSWSISAGVRSIMPRAGDFSKEKGRPEGRPFLFRAGASGA